MLLAQNIFLLLKIFQCRHFVFKTLGKYNRVLTSPFLVFLYVEGMVSQSGWLHWETFTNTGEVEDCDNPCETVAKKLVVKRTTCSMKEVNVVVKYYFNASFSKLRFFKILTCCRILGNDNLFTSQSPAASTVQSFVSFPLWAFQSASRGCCGGSHQISTIVVPMLASRKWLHTLYLMCNR